MILLNGLLVMLTAATVSIALHLHSVEEMETQLGEALRHIAATGVMTVDADLHAQIRSRQDVETDAFATLQGQIEAITRANELPLNAVYTLRPVRDGDKLVTEFVAMAGTPFTGDRYVLRPEMQRAMELRTVTSTPLSLWVYVESWKHCDELCTARRDTTEGYQGARVSESKSGSESGTLPHMLLPTAGYLSILGSRSPPRG